MKEKFNLIQLKEPRTPIVMPDGKYNLVTTKIADNVEMLPVGPGSLFTANGNVYVVEKVLVGADCTSTIYAWKHGKLKDFKMTRTAPKKEPNMRKA